MQQNALDKNDTIKLGKSICEKSLSSLQATDLYINWNRSQNRLSAASYCDYSNDISDKQESFEQNDLKLQTKVCTWRTKTCEKIIRITCM